MSAKRLLDMTRAWRDCEVELKQLRALLQVRDEQIEVMKGQIAALQTDNAQLRYELLCPKCKRYLDSKQPGDTILAIPCPSCIGTEGYAKNFFEVLKHSHLLIDIIVHHEHLRV